MNVIFLDGDESLWKRTGGNGNDSAQSSSSSWKDVTVDFAVTQAFAAASHITEMMTSDDPAMRIQMLCNTEFTSFVVGGETGARPRPGQTGLRALKDIVLPKAPVPAAVVDDGSRPPSAAHFAAMPHAVVGGGGRGGGGAANGDDDDDASFSPAVSAPSPAGMMHQQQQQQLQQWQQPQSQPQLQQVEMFGPISLAAVISEFATFLRARMHYQDAPSTPTPAHLVALFGRSAGVSVGDEAALDAALTALCDELNNNSGNENSNHSKKRRRGNGGNGNSSALASIAIDVILLPRPSSIADAVDEDACVCETLFELVERKQLTSSCRVTVSRAKDCSEVGSLVARAFLDRGAVKAF